MSREAWTAMSALQHSMRNYTVIDGESPSFGDAMRKALAIVRMHGELVDALRKARLELYWCGEQLARGDGLIPCGSVARALKLSQDLLTRAKALEDET